MIRAVCYAFRLRYVPPPFSLMFLCLFLQPLVTLSYNLYEQLRGLCLLL
jgi:hypothetical protein